MALPTGPIPYCMNVHPLATWMDVEKAFEDFVFPLAATSKRGGAVGLWLPRSLLDAPERERRLAALVRSCRERNVLVPTMNAFPFGDFHAERVKENVYQPDWASPLRTDYTCRAAEALLRFLPAGGEGSLSTLPLAFKASDKGAPSLSRQVMQLIETVRHLSFLRQESGKTIRLAIEPEPGCLLEQSAEVVRFFRRLWASAAATTHHRTAESDYDAVQRHVGVCLDVCHQAVEYENPADVVREWHAAGIRIVKVHLSSALELPDPRDAVARAALADYAEPRYLHQTTGRPAGGGERLYFGDLTAEFANRPPLEWLACDSWRVHFHVPIHLRSIGPLRTTTGDLEPTLRALAELPYAPDLEVETYTWGVLPKDPAKAGPTTTVSPSGALRDTENVFDARARQAAELRDGLAAELAHATALAERVRGAV